MSPEGLIEAAGNGEAGPWLMALGIVLISFVLEDAATIAAATLATQGMISLPFALGALIFGIALGDLGLYGIGALARRNAAARAWLEERGLNWAQGFFARNLFEVVIVARLVPGLRLPTYAALGLARASFPQFALFAVGAVSAWSSLIVVGTYYFDAALVQIIGEGWIRWVVIPLAVVVLILVPRLLLRRLAQRKRP